MRVAPYRVRRNVMGGVIANRLGDVSTFTAEDLRLFATVANHAGTALENGQLERSLAKLSILQDELKHQAFHDGLTQLANRGLFGESVNARLAATPRGRRSVVMFVDLDDFKFVNDMYGHPAGDAMLVEVAARLQACTRATDLTARLGGDEFAILVDDDPNLSNSERVAARIAEILQQPFSIGDVRTHVSASIGIAAGTQGDSAEDLLRQADVAMYSAKAAGKGRWVVYKPSMLKTVRSRHDVGAELQLAVDRGEFQLRYQPIVSLESGRIVGAEALVRWNHPTRDEVGPERGSTVPTVMTPRRARAREHGRERVTTGKAESAVGHGNRIATAARRGEGADRLVRGQKHAIRARGEHNLDRAHSSESEAVLVRICQLVVNAWFPVGGAPLDAVRIIDIVDEHDS